MSLFTKQEADHIADVVAEIEKRTSGEIVVAEVGRSDDYAEVRLFVTMMVGLVGASAAHLLLPSLSIGAVLAVQFAVGVVVWFLSGLTSVLRLLLPGARVDRAVGRAAELAFFEHAVFATRDRTGVLIFLSGLEHRVVILGDEGIHARVQNPGWEELVNTLIASIKRGHAGDGVCEIVTKLGTVLAGVAPARDDDTNELDNRVRTR